MAQRNKLTIPRRSILGIEEFATPTAVLADDILQEGDLLFVTLNLTNAARTNPATSVKVRFFTSRDDGATWLPVAGITFTGDPGLPSTTPIGVGVAAAQLIGARIKAQIDCAQTTSVGLSVLIGSVGELGL